MGCDSCETKLKVFHVNLPIATPFHQRSAWDGQFVFSKSGKKRSMFSCLARLTLRSAFTKTSSFKDQMKWAVLKYKTDYLSFHKFPQQIRGAKENFWTLEKSNVKVLMFHPLAVLWCGDDAMYGKSSILGEFLTDAPFSLFSLVHFISRYQTPWAGPSIFTVKLGLNYSSALGLKSAYPLISI